MSEHDEIADHHEIVQLTHRYCWALDEGDWDTLRSSVFTADATSDLGAGGQNGIDEIVERVSTALAVFDITQHMVATHQIEIDGDTSSGRCYLQAQHVRPTGDKLMIGATYDDTYVRTADGWRINYRKITALWTEGQGGIKK